MSDKGVALFRPDGSLTTLGQVRREGKDLRVRKYARLDTRRSDIDRYRLAVCRAAGLAVIIYGLLVALVHRGAKRIPNLQQVAQQRRWMCADEKQRAYCGHVSESRQPADLSVSVLWILNRPQCVMRSNHDT